MRKTTSTIAGVRRKRNVRGIEAKSNIEDPGCMRIGLLQDGRSIGRMLHQKSSLDRMSISGTEHGQNL